MLHGKRPGRVGSGMAAIAVAAGLIVGVSACGGSDNSGGSGGSKSDITVGLITKTDTNPFFVKMKAGAQKAANEQGVKLVTAAGKYDGDNASQVTAINNMVASGVKG